MLGIRYAYDGKAIIHLSEDQIKARAKLLEKHENLYHLINVDCECGNDTYEVLSEKDRYGLPVTTVICRKCGLIYQNPRLDEESSKDFYSTLYRKLYDASPISERFDEQVKRGKSIVSWLHGKLSRFPRRVVEIGCGAGGVLKVFQNMGTKTFGVDFNEAHINYGRRKGLQLEIGGAEKIPQDQADLVILSHALEHFVDVGKELDVIHDLLLPEGYLYVETPGIINLRQYSYDFLKSLQNAHNYYFTLETLEQVLSFYGWKLKQGDESISSLFRYEKLKNNIIKNYYPKIRSKLIYFEKIRPIGQLISIRSTNQLMQFGAHAIHISRD